MPTSTAAKPSRTTTRTASARGRRPAPSRPSIEDGPLGRPLRVAIYIRISTDEEHQPFSLEAQIAKLSAYITSQPGWEMVGKPYRDEASGATLERPDLQKALAAARAGRFDVLLVYRVDRLARSLRGLVHILDELDQAGVVFRSATEPFDTSTPAGRMLVQMLGVFAQFERDMIIDRVINGMERKAAKGQWCGGYRPYGYTLDHATGFLTPVDAEASLVPTIFTLYTAKRYGSAALAKELVRRGHRTKNGQRWSAQSVLTVLRNRAYLGEVYFRGTWYKADPHHPALIDEATFVAAEQIMIARGENHSHRAANASDYYFAGKTICGHCGKRYLGTAAHGKTARYAYYTCYSKLRYGRNVCDADRIRADQLHAVILQAMLAVYADTDLIEQAVAAVAGRRGALRAEQQAEVDAIDAKLAANEAAIDRYLSSFEAGTLPESVAGTRVTALADSNTELRHRRDELQAILDLAGPQTPDPVQLPALRAEITGAIRSADTRQIKPVVEALVHEIRIDGRGHIQPTFRLPAGTTLKSGSRVREMTETVPPVGFEPTLCGF